MKWDSIPLRERLIFFWGGSHSGNMSAANAIENNSVDILCSDYFPQALLHSLFVMCEKYGQKLPDMVNKVSLNPAKAMGIDKDYGSLEAGKKADIVIADILDGYPVVTHVLVDGKTTSRVEYRSSHYEYTYNQQSWETVLYASCKPHDPFLRKYKFYA